MARLILQTALSTTTTTTSATIGADGVAAAAAAGMDDGASNGTFPTFEQLVALHEPRIRRLARRLLGWRNDDDADDVVQDVLLVLLSKLDTFRGDASLSTWLTTVTINKCRTHRRKQWLRLGWFRNHRPGHLNDHACGADHDATRDDTNARVREAVQSLSPRDREVIVLFYLEALGSRDIADVLGIKPAAVDTRLHRARQRLKEKLSDLTDE